MDKRWRTTLIVFLWLVIWQIVSLLINNSILLVGPIEVIKSLCLLAVTKTFWISICNSACRILGGFLIGALLAFLLAFIANKFKLFEEFLSPFIVTLKSIPVASFVIIVLIWVGAPMLSLIITCLVVLPIVYISTLEGLKSVDNKLIEMANMFNMKPFTKFRQIYFRSLRPFLFSSLSLASGMAVKSGIAAEVIGRPRFSMGNGLYSSKAYLNTGDIFAWTLAAIILAFLFEKIVKFLLRRFLTK